MVKYLQLRAYKSEEDYKSRDESVAEQVGEIEDDVNSDGIKKLVGDYLKEYPVVEVGKFSCKYKGEVEFDDKFVPIMVIKNIELTIDELATKAAEKWVGLSEEAKEIYEYGTGTSTIFEEVDLESYQRILNADNEDGTLFWKLDELWDKKIDELEKEKK